MKKWMLRLGISLPYAFLAMGADAMWDIFLLYPSAALCIALLSRAAKKTEQPWACFACGVVGLILSVALSACVTDERWQWYFKPFSAEFMAAMISLLLLGAPWVVLKKKRG